MKAKLSNFRQSPRKVRLVADLIRGKNADKAVQILKYTNKKAAESILKVLESAISNAKSTDSSVEAKDLYIKEVKVDEGQKLKRSIPRAMGRATPIFKRASHINMELGVMNNEVNKETKEVEKVK